MRRVSPLARFCSDAAGGSSYSSRLWLRGARNAWRKNWVGHLGLFASQAVQKCGDLVDLIIRQLNAQLTSAHHGHGLPQIP